MNISTLLTPTYEAFTNSSNATSAMADYSGGRVAYGVVMSLGILLYLLSGGFMAYWTISSQVKAANKPTPP